jgi:hypothetical protein
MASGGRCGSTPDFKRNFITFVFSVAIAIAKQRLFQ